MIVLFYAPYSCRLMKQIDSISNAILTTNDFILQNKQAMELACPYHSPFLVMPLYFICFLIRLLYYNILLYSYFNSVLFLFCIFMCFFNSSNIILNCYGNSRCEFRLIRYMCMGRILFLNLHCLNFIYRFTNHPFF